MKRWIDRWPAMLWPGMSLASLYILIGTSGRWRPGAFAVGVVLALITFGLALWLATRPLPGRAGDRRLFWPMFGLGAWYLALAAAAATAGPWYAVAGLAAGLIPLTALSLMVATIRRKTVVDEEGRAHDASAADNEDPWPGIGLDDETVMGETSELSDYPSGAKDTRRFVRDEDREAHRNAERERDAAQKRD